MEFDSPSNVLLCRLCLREYENDYMHGIFSEYSNLEERILLAVSVKPNCTDLTITICSNCKDLIDLINNFRAACQETNDLLQTQTSILRSSTWNRSAVEETFSHAASLVQKHRKEVKYVTKIDEPDYDEVTEDFLDYLQLPSSKVLQPTTTTTTARNAVIAAPQQKIVCATCGQLVSPAAFEGHMNRHAGVQPFACDEPGCETKLYSRHALQQHKSRHKTTSRYYDCEVCGKRIKGTAYWLLHRKIHTEEPRFECDICGKKFRRKCKLKEHSTVHTGIAKFRCEICDKRFTIKHNLMAHYKIHARKGEKTSTEVSQTKVE